MKKLLKDVPLIRTTEKYRNRRPDSMCPGTKTPGGYLGFWTNTIGCFFAPKYSV